MELLNRTPNAVLIGCIFYVFMPTGEFNTNVYVPLASCYLLISSIESCIVVYMFSIESCIVVYNIDIQLYKIIYLSACTVHGDR